MQCLEVVSRSNTDFTAIQQALAEHIHCPDPQRLIMNHENAQKSPNIRSASREDQAFFLIVQPGTMLTLLDPSLARNY